MTDASAGIDQAKEKLGRLTAPGDQADLDKAQAAFTALQAHCYGEFQLGIINAIPRERAAIEKVFGKPSKLPVNRGAVSYDVVLVEKENTVSVPVVVAGIAGQGTIQTATATASLAQRLPYLKKVILVGIAAGQPAVTNEERDVWLGDVIVGDSVVQYDHIKRTSATKIECRGTSINPPSPQLVQVARSLLAEMEANPHGPWAWEVHIAAAQANWPVAKRPSVKKDPNGGARKYTKSLHRHANDRPHVKVGRIGSANILLKDAKFRDAVAKLHGTIAYEMEGAGLALAAPEFDLQYLLVRGICDYGDATKNDSWQAYAALAAAAVARTLIGRL